MFWNSASKYNVDVRLVIALIQQDSQFATLGLAVTTFNPGNVGNDGTNTHVYPSWEDGVDAVANWLNNHRTQTAPVIIPETTIVEPIIKPIDTTENTPVESSDTTNAILPETAPTEDSDTNEVSNPVVSKATRKTRNKLS